MAALLRRVISPPPVVAVVPFAGLIAPRVGLGWMTLAVETVGPVAARAFRARPLAEVALVINSPGGF